MSVLFLNCNPNKDEVINLFITKFSNGDFKSHLPSANKFYHFFLKIGNNKIAIIYNRDLYEIYDKIYSKKFKTYKIFLKEIYVNDLVVDFESIINKPKVVVFDLDKDTQLNSLDELIIKYGLIKKEENCIVIKNGINLKKLNNLKYKFFKSQFIIIPNHILGETYMFKVTTDFSRDF